LYCEDTPILKKYFNCGMISIVRKWERGDDLEKEKLIKEIETAFKNVKLDNGIGIFEAEELDACSSDKKIEKARKKDRSWWKDWHHIEDKHLAYYSSPMCFMDSQGIKWALPAYMIYALNHYEDGAFSVDTTIYTIERGALGYDKKNTYTLEQKKVIAKFLQYMLFVGEDWVDTYFTKMALDKEWKKYL